MRIEIWKIILVTSIYNRPISCLIHTYTKYTCRIQELRGYVQLLHALFVLYELAMEKRVALR